MERYLYFSEATVETTGENAMYPLASFIGMTPAGGASTTLHFSAAAGSITDDQVQIAHTGKTFKEFAQLMATCLQRNHRNPILILKDGPGGTRAFDGLGVNAITLA
tara:strand:+ start:63 stop:380 length:318 start_codon:yes stop_codon:yes gene_type:complete